MPTISLNPMSEEQGREREEERKYLLRRHRQRNREFNETIEVDGTDHFAENEEFYNLKSCLISKKTEPRKALRYAKHLAKTFYNAQKIRPPSYLWETKCLKLMEDITQKKTRSEAKILERMQKIQSEINAAATMARHYLALGVDEKNHSKSSEANLIEDQAAMIVDQVLSNPFINSIHTSSNTGNGDIYPIIVTNRFLLKDPNHDDDIHTPALQIHLDDGTRQPPDETSIRRQATFYLVSSEMGKWPWLNVSNRPHPHIEASILCHGSGALPASRAWKRGELGSYLSIIFSVLENYNPHSPYITLRDFIKPEMRECIECETLIRVAHLYTLGVDGNTARGGKTANICENCGTIVRSKTGKAMVILRRLMTRGLYNDQPCEMWTNCDPVFMPSGYNRVAIPHEEKAAIAAASEFFEFYDKDIDSTVEFCVVAEAYRARMSLNRSVNMFVTKINGKNDIESIDVGRRDMSQKWRSGGFAVNRCNNFFHMVKKKDPSTNYGYAKITRDEESYLRHLSRQPQDVPAAAE